jgi:hypothetical protein
MAVTQSDKKFKGVCRQHAHYVAHRRPSPGPIVGARRVSVQGAKGRAQSGLCKGPSLRRCATARRTEAVSFTRSSLTATASRPNCAVVSRSSTSGQA